MRRLLSSALLCTYVVLLSAAPPAAAQVAVRPEESRPVSVDASIDRAFDLLDHRQHAQAQQLLAPLLTPALTDRQRARTERALGQAYLALGQRSRAVDAFGRALQSALAADDRAEAGWARRWAGVVRYGDGESDAALTLWNAARDDFVAAGDLRGEFEVLDDLVNRLTGLARRPYSERCVAIARAERDPLLEARARARWGHGLLEAGLPGPALIELQRATTVMRPLGGRADPYFGDALAVLGWALRAHGANEGAVPVHREAIRLARQRGDNDSQIWNYLGLGAALTELGRGQQAEAAMSAGLRAARRGGASTNIRMLMEALGWVAMRRDRWREAVRLIESARAMPGVETTAMTLVNLARAYRALGRLPEAAERAAAAVEVARRLGLVDNEIRALTEAAQVEVARGQLDTAEQTLRDIASRLETYRANLAPVDFLKQGFADRFSDAYGLMVDLYMRRGRQPDALAAAERVRARAFADVLAGRRAREQEDAATAQWLLGDAIGDENTAAIRERRDSPLVIPSLDAAALAGLARRLSSTLVVYWIHESGSYAWVIDGTGEVQAARLRTNPRDLRRAVQRAVDAVPEMEISASPAGTVTTVSSGRNAFRSLYATLWAPIASFVRDAHNERVTVIPHGPLLALPYAALIDAQGRYLVERYALHYAASGAVLQEALDASERPIAETTPNLLVADPAGAPSTDAGAPLPALRAARHEVQMIARILGHSPNLLVGRRASEAAVRAALPKAALAHFATHALVRDRDPLGSHLLLGAAPGATADDDGRLTASEIAGMRLSSRLVVLGACRSARGPISSDGIAGLTRAFMAAGAPSVVATLWDATDVPTSRVMIRFYRGYAAGVPKDQALRAAQLDLIADLRAGRVTGTLGQTTVKYPEHPWLWAAPILVGAP